MFTKFEGLGPEIFFVKTVVITTLGQEFSSKPFSTTTLSAQFFPKLLPVSGLGFSFTGRPGLSMSLSP